MTCLKCKKKKELFLDRSFNRPLESSNSNRTRVRNTSLTEKNNSVRSIVDELGSMRAAIRGNEKPGLAS